MHRDSARTSYAPGGPDGPPPKGDLPPLYLLKGLRLLLAPGIRRFVLVPLVINVAIFGLVGWWLSSWVAAWLAPDVVEQGSGWFTSTFARLRELLAFAAKIVVWLSLAWVYTFVANIVAAPFNGVLSERVEAHLTGRALPEGGSFLALCREVPRALASEAAKLWYLVSRFVPLLLLGFIPGFNVLAPALVFLFGAWVFALEYLEYPMGNHGMRFRDVRVNARQQPRVSLSFGAVVALTSSIPIINLAVMPAAVAGATALWVDRWPDRWPDR
jgi:CysZ protein